MYKVDVNLKFIIHAEKLLFYYQKNDVLNF